MLYFYEEISAIVDLISNFEKSDYISLGIIYKTKSQAKYTPDKLKTNTDKVYFLSRQSSLFVKGIIVTSAHIAKGLKFDKEIVP